MCIQEKNNALILGKGVPFEANLSITPIFFNFLAYRLPDTYMIIGYMSPPFQVMISLVSQMHT